MSSAGSQVLRGLGANASPRGHNITPIEENMAEEFVDLDSFNKCSITGAALNEDERIINYRLMK